MPASQLPSKQQVLGAVSMQETAPRGRFIEGWAGLESTRAGLAGVAVMVVPSVIAAGSVNSFVRPEPPATQRLESESRFSI